MRKSMNILKEVKHSRDDITRKFHFQLRDRCIIQLVLVERPEKNIICFPSQIGCCLHCKICRSKELVRNLNAEEIYSCVMTIKEHIKDETKPLLLSCMGEGEPSLNRNIVDIFEKLNEISDRFALATTGINTSIFSNMNVFKDKMKIMLSLHGTTVKQRYDLLNNNMDLKFLLDEFQTYEGKKEVNYILLNKFNDSIASCVRLRKLVKSIPVKINNYNKTVDVFTKSDRLGKFMSLYKTMGGKIEYYETDGIDIAAACGMLTHHLR